jgi:hypothetical protein
MCICKYASASDRCLSPCPGGRPGGGRPGDQMRVRRERLTGQIKRDERGRACRREESAWPPTTGVRERVRGTRAWKIALQVCSDSPSGRRMLGWEETRGDVREQAGRGAGARKKRVRKQEGTSKDSEAVRGSARGSEREREGARGSEREQAVSK